MAAAAAAVTMMMVTTTVIPVCKCSNFTVCVFQYQKRHKCRIEFYGGKNLIIVFVNFVSSSFFATTKTRALLEQ